MVIADHPVGLFAVGAVSFRAGLVVLAAAGANGHCPAGYRDCGLARDRHPG